MREYGVLHVSFWTDHRGQGRRVPLGALCFKYPAHRALRAFIYQRDGFKCRDCGQGPQVASENYEGQFTPMWGERYLVIDHIRSRRNGGSNHPDNLQTLCDSCNSTKANVIDRRGG